ncbi:MAG: putative baseplate assembly protein, partial [Alphaproteobacteria bacterium]|nr:putative baseplate assembly protein [Alphaproteobacteria bacterium]
PPVDDGTDGFTRPGVIRLILPDHDEIGLPENDPDLDVLAGVGDRPPRIDDPEKGARLVGWLRLKPRMRPETLSLAWVGVNAVEIEQRQSLRNIVIGTATGGGDQKIQMPATSVDPESLGIEVQRADGLYDRWQRTDELWAHGRDDKVFSLDSEAGVLTFGDGLRGALPPRGAKVRAALIRFGGGRAGNLPPASLEAIAHPRLIAAQPIATRGGEDAETLDAAEKRIPSRLRHGDRAVTERDFQELALETPGVDLARVIVMPRFRPFQRLSDVPGTVSVMVVPRPDRLEAPHPRADRSILFAVRMHLDARRLMGTELHVIGPEYRPIAVSASVKVRDGAAPDRVLADVEAALRAHLAPVAPGGREGTGWPLGQTVGNLELEVVIARVAGVEIVYGVNLFKRETGTGGWSLVAVNDTGQQRVTLEEWMLPELLDVVLAQDPAGAPTDVAGTDGGGGDDSTPIPVVPELC